MSLSNLAEQSTSEETADTSYMSTLSLEEVKRHLLQVKEEKKVLESKIRGYITLSDIFHTQKEEHKKLKKKYDYLVTLLNSKQKQPQSMDQKLDINNAPDPERTTDTATEAQTTPDRQTPAARSSADASVASLAESLEDMSASKEHGTHPTGKVVIPVRSVSTPLQSFVRETVPMQESMAEEIAQSGAAVAGSSPGESPPSGIDLGQSARMSGDRDNFVHISTSVHGQPSKDFSFAGMKDQSIALSSLERNLETERVSEQVVQHVRDEFLKLERKVKHLEDTNAVLIEENNSLRSTNKLLVSQLKEVKEDLKNTQKHQVVSSETGLQDGGWIRVDKISESKQTDDASGDSQVSKMQTEIAQLKEANQQWVQKWEDLQQHVQSQVDTLQQERDQLTRQLTDLKIMEEKNKRDWGKTLEGLKKKCQEEEAAKENALLQLAQSDRRADSLQEKLTTVEGRLHNIEREKQTLDVQLSVVKQQPVMAGGTPGPPLRGPGPGPSPGLAQKQLELQTENEVLRQQLLVFQEDFDRERQDRANAQSHKEQYKKKNESLKSKVRLLEQKVASLEKQTSNAEDALQNAMEDKQRLQQELCEVKNQLRREQEAVKAQFYHMAPQYGNPAAMMQQPYMGPLYNQPPPMYAQLPPNLMPQYVPPVSQNLRTTDRGYQHYQENPVIPPRVEALPGAWNCRSCTYKNYPGRTVCEMCGYVQTHGQNGSSPAYRPNHGMLRPRGDEANDGFYHPNNNPNRRGLAP